MRVLADMSPRVLCDAIEWNLIGLFASFGGIPGARVDHGPDMMRLITGLPHELMNGVFRPRLDSADITSTIDDALVDFRSRELPMTWWAGPSTQPADLGTNLERRGLIRIGDLTGMAVDLAALNENLPAPPEFSVERVENEATLREWIAPIAFGFEFPEAAAFALFELFRRIGFGPDAPFRHYLGRWGGNAVAACTMYLGAGVAGTHATVVPNFRRQGIGAAMSLAPLRDSRDLGYRIAVTQTSALGLGFHRKIGFREYCKFDLYVPKDQTR